MKVCADNRGLNTENLNAAFENAIRYNLSSAYNTDHFQHDPQPDQAANSGDQAPPRRSGEDSSNEIVQMVCTASVMWRHRCNIAILVA
jgi:hypothetical protein